MGEYELFTLAVAITIVMIIGRVVADRLGGRPRGLAGMSLGITPKGR